VSREDSHSRQKSHQRNLPIAHGVLDVAMPEVRLQDARVVSQRGMGSYHNVSRKYPPLYVAEFQFRYNNRGNTDIFQAAISQCHNNHNHKNK
jgi:hypothetical protein